MHVAIAMLIAIVPCLAHAQMLAFIWPAWCVACRVHAVLAAIMSTKYAVVATGTFTYTLAIAAMSESWSPPPPPLQEVPVHGSGAGAGAGGSPLLPWWSPGWLSPCAPAPPGPVVLAVPRPADLWRAWTVMLSNRAASTPR